MKSIQEWSGTIDQFRTGIMEREKNFIKGNISRSKGLTKVIHKVIYKGCIGVIFHMIKGFIPFTLVDFPGKVAASIFTGGCNFNCPWCQNRSLIDRDYLSLIEDIPLNSILDNLKRKKGKIEGVCITGGEPTVWKDQLFDFISIIKSEGFLVKLDTNGSNPEVLQFLLTHKMIDFVAMDIKNVWEKYLMTIGLRSFSLNKIESSIELIKNSDIGHQFRTTLVPELVEKSSMEDFAQELDIEIHFQEYRSVFS